MRHITKIFLVPTFLLLSVTSCLTDFDFGQNPDDYTIVIDGVITNIAELNHVKLTKSSNDFDNLFAPYDDPLYDDRRLAEPINDALVIISDDLGKRDTLIVQDSVSSYEFLFDDDFNVIDTLTEFRFPVGEADAGVYRLEDLVGEPGRTYSLYVEHNGLEYSAEGYMNQLPPKVDSAQVNSFVVKEADGTIGYVPSIFFEDPPEKNYYYFNLWAFYSGGSWNISIMDDELLETQVSGFNIDDGVNPDWWGVNYPFGDDSGTIQVEMAFISKEVYEYYENLIGQFNNDGGVYSPSPASPVSNISNGALGVFRVSSVNIIEIEY